MSSTVNSLSYARRVLKSDEYGFFQQVASCSIICIQTEMPNSNSPINGSKDSAKGKASPYVQQQTRLRLFQRTFGWLLKAFISLFGNLQQQQMVIHLLKRNKMLTNTYSQI